MFNLGAHSYDRIKIIPNCVNVPGQLLPELTLELARLLVERNTFTDHTRLIRSKNEKEKKRIAKFRHMTRPRAGEVYEGIGNAQMLRIPAWDQGTRASEKMWASPSSESFWVFLRRWA